MEGKDKSRLWIAITGAATIIAVIAFWGALGWGSHALLASVTLGIIIATFFVFLRIQWEKKKDKKVGFPSKDERTKYIEGRAAHYAVMISSWFMLGLMWYAFLSEGLGLPELKTVPALILSVLVMCCLYLGLRGYFFRKANI